MAWQDTNKHNFDTAIRSLKKVRINGTDIACVGSIWIGYLQRREKVLFGFDEDLMPKFGLQTDSYGLPISGLTFTQNDLQDCMPDDNDGEKDRGKFEIEPDTLGWPARGTDPVILQQVMMNIPVAHMPARELRGHFERALRSAAQNAMKASLKIRIKYADEDRYRYLR